MWHNQGVDTGDQERRGRRRRERPPLGAEALNELALAYVSRFATTRVRLLQYLRRKLAERGWAGEEQPPLEALADRLVELGYVDDAAFAMSKSRSLSARGYGARRLDQALRAAGVGEDDSSEARTVAEEAAAEAALRFARRKRLGPFAMVRPDPKTREKALAAMIRAGHGFTLARAIVDALPGQELSPKQLVEDGL